MSKNKKIEIIGTEVIIYTQNEQDFISLTDIARFRDADRSDYILQNWMRNRSTIEFIGLWEQFNNPDFNSIEFDGIKTWLAQTAFHLRPSVGSRQPTPWELFVAITQMKSLVNRPNTIKKIN